MTLYDYVASIPKEQLFTTEITLVSGITVLYQGAVGDIPMEHLAKQINFPVSEVFICE